MRKAKITVNYLDRQQTVTGWIEGDIFLCKADSLGMSPLWYAFDVKTGKCLQDGRTGTSRKKVLETVLYWREKNLLDKWYAYLLRRH